MRPRDVNVTSSIDMKKSEQMLEELSDHRGHVLKKDRANFVFHATAVIMGL